ncbi:hypothetical protein OG989_19290 [Micromonospora sp. NBC_01740]|uniref:hypothetical protein n=1 Tax=Micromonospora sp. NBC_01740 TaxID=2975986 RepID=UPI002E108C08|nr:hypothetical protein OG989_19290 [Micromonospora sp. NBC_01740]
MSTSSWQLRPTVQATRIDGGLHLRSWDTSLTLDGAPQLWRLWQLLTRRLAAGRTTADLRDLSPRPPVALALYRLADLLREHDLLVRVPEHWAGTGHAHAPADACGPAPVPPPAVATWLASVATDPAASWTGIGRESVTVTGTGPAATAAIEALTAAGARVRRAATRIDAPRDAGRVTLAASDGRAVVTGASATVGYVTPVGPGRQLRAQSGLIAERLGLDGAATAPGDPVSVVAGACAAHRLLGALAELTDPTAPTALVVRSDPLRATAHPWPPGVRSPAVDAPDRRDDAVHAGLPTSLTDPELGVLPPVELDDLPQLPVGLARCRVGGVPGPAGGTLVTGHGPDTSTARLHATLAAVELLSVSTGGAAVLACGVDRSHAEGVLLRRLARRSVASAGVTSGEAVPPSAFDAPAARRWWRTLTRRLGVPATVHVRRLAPGAQLAVVSGPDTTDPGGWMELGWAIEATAHDAVAFAALTAVATVGWRAHRPGPPYSHGPCGASPRVSRSAAPMPDGSEREAALRRSLRTLVGAPAEPVVVTPPAPLAAALRTVGLVVLRAGDDR